MDLPELFCQRMTSLLASSAPDFFSALANPPQRALRFAPEKIDRDALEERLGSGLGEPIPFDPHAYRFHFDGIGHLPEHHGGAIYVQEPAAMAPVAALPEEKFSRILDLCSAPGGKSIQAWERYLKNGGLLVCNEPEPVRRRALMQNLERWGIRNCQVTGFSGEAMPREMEEGFDLVICDAPCSGEGMMRKTDTGCLSWSRERIESLAALQKKILDCAARCLKPGGVLLYSTCTWSTEENEEQVVSFLSRHMDFSLISPTSSVEEVSLPGVPLATNLDLSKTRRFYPHIFPGEGQFLALFRKIGEESGKEKKKEKKRDAKPDPGEKIAREFLENTLEKMPEERIFLRRDEVYLLPPCGLDPSLTVSPGVLVGKIQKGRIVPHHRFFLSYCSHMKNKHVLPPDDARIEAYLRGEEIDLAGESGYGVLFAHTCPLGGVKVSGGRGKNLYPKGLRKG